MKPLPHRARRIPSSVLLILVDHLTH
jgi:hypothetical protein